jgi:hypothetical protein
LHQPFARGLREASLVFRQQPDGDAGDTPGVAAAPVALAGAIVPGVDRLIVTLSAQADVFGVGTIVIVGSMLVAPSWVISCWIVPGGGFAGIAGVESGKAAPLVGGPPGVELHTVVDELPTGDTGDMVPVVLPTIGVGMVPNGADDIVAIDDIVVVDGVIVAALPAVDGETVFGMVDGVGTGVAVVEGGGAAIADDVTGTVEPGKSDMNDDAGCADSSNGAVVLAVAGVEEIAGTADAVGAADVGVTVAPPTADMDATGTAAVPGVICPDGVEQVTTVPGVVGSEASGTGANVVTGVPGCVAAENGLGPLSGDVTIAPGVDERPMAVLPMVETCAGQAVHPASMVANVKSKRRISIPSASSWPTALHAPRPCCLPPGSPSD